MAPKRKNKAPTKPDTATAQSQAQAASAIRTSLLKRRRSSVQGVKTSTSRLQPSEPLHMTTRGAAKAASNHTSPAAPSVADGSSRRSSLDGVAQFQDDHSDAEDERPAKRSRVSTDSGSPPGQMGSFVSQIPVIETDAINTPSRAASLSSKSSANKRRASGDSSETSKTVSARPNGLLTRSESDLSEKAPRRKKRKTNGPPPEPAEPPDLTDGSSPAGSPEAMLDVTGSQGQNLIPTINGDLPAKVSRRLPGRRRQPHSDVNVETDLRRQLNIKMGYRSLAKIQKTFLEELSNRTINGLENDPNFHQQSPEYDHMMGELAQRRQSRIDQLAAERRLRLEQLERVREAESRIQKEQYLNRFEELRDDYVLQCHHRLQQLERQMKAGSGDATDDEDHIIEPTRWDYPQLNVDDRIAPKYASRSRAYVETERMLDRADLQRRFDQQLKSFVADNEDLDDSLDNLPGGFARFTGPDRADALVHYQVANLVDAAAEIERIPPPPDPPKIIPNEQADALFFLASLSAERPPEPSITSHQQYPVPQPPQVATPAQQVEPHRQVSPFAAPLSIASTAMSLETAQSSPAKPIDVQESNVHAAPRHDSNGVFVKQEPDITKNEMPTRLTTHRIMDILNDDQEVPVSKLRESQAPIKEQAHTASPRRESINQYQPLSQTSSIRLDALIHNHERSPLQRATKSEEEHALFRSASPSHNSQFWSSSTASRPSEQNGPEDSRNPLVRLRQMLDRKEERDRFIAAENAARDRSVEATPRLESVDRAQMAPPLPRSFSPKDRSDTGKDSRRTSVGAYSASPSSGPMSYDRSPRDRPMPYPQHHRQSSYDQGARPSWDTSRRMSGSQGPQPSPAPQYAGSPHPQPYASDYSKSGPTPSAHQSPYPPPSAPQLPPFNQQPSSSSLPPKPPTASSHTPINFRFAHYEPVQPRNSFHQHTNYPPTSHPPPPTAPPHPSRYPSPYSSQSSYQGYVPPPGSFQAPPPPPPPPTHANSPYPPLKIHQYGGQPILPASMAPSLSHSQGSMSPYSTQSSLPAPTTQMYSPQGPPASQGPPRPQYEHSSSSLPPPPPPGPAQQQERPDPQPRPRRQYRSYHAPGTEFRSYQGPNHHRRRGT